MKFDDDAMRQIMKDVARQLDDADRAFRATHEGFPEGVVLADAADVLPVDLPPDVLAAYAGAVSRGEPFEFKLVT